MPWCLLTEPSTGSSYWKSSAEQFRDSHPRYAVILRLDARAAEELMTWRKAQRIDGGTVDGDGWITLRTNFDTEEHGCFYALGLGARAEVLDPPALREKVLANANAIVARERTRS